MECLLAIAIMALVFAAAAPLLLKASECYSAADPRMAMINEGRIGLAALARDFREAARTLNVRLEYAGVQCPEDKPYIESFFGSYKTEELYRNEYNSLAEARTGWESYRAWYRNERLHQALWYKSPRDYAKITFQSKLLVA